MSIDVRILGRGSDVEQFEALDQSSRRWLLCSRDYLRSAVLLSAVSTPTDRIFDAYPVSNMVDGNRMSYCLTTDDCSQVVLIFDTQNTDRKALLFIEYLEGQEINIKEVALSNDWTVDALWNVVSPSALYRGNKFALWKMPFDAVASQSAEKTITSDSGVTIIVNYSDASNTWVGGYAVANSGPNAGMQRRVIGWNLGTSTLTLESPFPVANPAGTLMQVKKFAANYLGSRYVKITLNSRWHGSTGPLAVVGLSLFNYVMELKGDIGAFRATRAPNPSAVGADVNPAGVVHDVLNGNSRLEQRTGPKDGLRISWGAAFEGFYDFVKQWGATGIVGIVDETGMFRQGYVSRVSKDRLEDASNCGPEVGLTMNFTEV